VEVYTENGAELLAIFNSITEENIYKVLLTNLQTPTDVFDLKVAGDSVDFDYIVDPTVGDSFSDETKIGRGSTTAMATTNVVLNSGVTIAPCYTPSPSWTQVVVTDHNPAQCATNSTYVRDLSYTADATHYICKDIYCDNTNCILWTAGATAPGTVCIATDTNVYPQTILGYGLLWSKTDTAATQTWADSNFSISGGDIGGTHTTNKAGSGSTTITGYNWLERYYTTTAGTFNAMDACKTKGLGWRMPNILELDSIRDQTAASGVYSRLPNIIANGYWSSSEASATYPFRLEFGDGGVYTNDAKSTAYYVRCVRGY